MKTRFDFVSNSSSSSYIIQTSNKEKFLKFVKKYRYLLGLINHVQCGDSYNYDGILVDDNKFNDFINNISVWPVYSLNVGNPDQDPDCYNVALYSLLTIADHLGFKIIGCGDTSYHNDWLTLKDLKQEYKKQKQDYDEQYT